MIQALNLHTHLCPHGLPRPAHQASRNLGPPHMTGTGAYSATLFPLDGEERPIHLFPSRRALC